MPITTKDLESRAQQGWSFIYRFVWPALVGGMIIGAVLEHFLKF
jgi:hypothetical protein